MEVGQVVKGKVVEVLNLVQISSRKWCSGVLFTFQRFRINMSKVDILKVGQDVEAKIIGKGKDGKWELSLKEEMKERH